MGMHMPMEAGKNIRSHFPVDLTLRWLGYVDRALEIQYPSNLKVSKFLTAFRQNLNRIHKTL